MRQASVIVADDVTYHLNGKLNIFGAFVGDIIIPVAPVRINQLVFLIIIESDPEDPFKIAHFQITLPSGQKSEGGIPVEGLMLTESDKLRWSLRWPILFQAPLLTPGPISVKILHERGEILAIAPVIKVLSAPEPNAEPQT